MTALERALDVLRRVADPDPWDSPEGIARDARHALEELERDDEPAPPKPEHRP